MTHKIKKIIAATVAVATLAAGCVGAAGCNYCAHQLEVIEKENSTCIEHGHAYSYKCKKCDKLFAYTTEKGLYEISQAEELPLGDHVASDAFNVRLKEGIETASSIFDYEFVTVCKVCEAEMPVPEEHLVKIVPPNLNKAQDGVVGGSEVYEGTYKYNEDGDPYTSIKFLSSTKPDNTITLDPYKYAYAETASIKGDTHYGPNYKWVFLSSWGPYQRFPLYIPFKANVERQVYYIIKNTHATETINVSWCIDGNNWANIDIAPGEVKPLLVKGTKSYDTPVEPQYIKIKNAKGGKTLGKPVTVEIRGIYYTPGTVATLDVDEMPVKTQYDVGEKFDTTGLQIYAKYAEDDLEFRLGKTVDLSKCQFSCGDKPLTKDDNKVTISYGGARVSINITVTEGGAENG